MNIIQAALCCVLLALTSVLQAETKKSSQEAPASVRAFVHSFYDWYVSRMLSDVPAPAWSRALGIKGDCFSSELIRRLREDSTAQAKARGEIVGLDFDPFLNSQDPSGHYRVGTVAHKQNTYWADIQDVSAGSKPEEPRVVAEVGRENGRWYFVNFHYPEGSDLLAVLRSLRESRERVQHSRTPKTGSGSLRGPLIHP